MSTINYRIKIGEKEYEIPVGVASQQEGKLLLDGDDFLRAQWELGKKLVKEIQDSSEVNFELFNFLVDISVRLFFFDLFSNGHITNEIFITNKSKKIAA